MTEKEKAKQAIIAEIVDKGDKGEPLSEDELLIYKTYKRVEKEERSWLVRNAWWIITGTILFLIRMCSELSK